MPHEREQLILDNLKLVYYVCKKYRGCHWHDDVCQEGMIGLIKASRTFDLSRGVKFSNYALPFIRGEILHYLRDKVGTIKTPRNKEAYKIISDDIEDERKSIKEVSTLDMINDVIDAINKLPSPEAQIIKLHYLDGIKQKDIATKLCLQKMTVNRFIKQAIAHLRNTLKEYAQYSE